MTISMDKKYKTRDGEPVRLLCTDAKGPYPVVGLVRRTDVDIFGSWAADGRIMAFGKLKSGNDLIEVQPYEDFKIDGPVMVRNYNDDEWVHRHFAGVSKEDGLAMTWMNGKTSFTTKHTTTWNQCRRPTPDELELEENATEE